MRKGSWKIVKELEDIDWELYNLANDPTETKNLAKESVEMVKTMKLEYEDWAKKVGVKNVKAKE